MFESAQVPTVDPEHALRLASAGAVLVDVREPYEWEAGHAPTAVHVPLAALPTADVPAGDGPVLVICRSGHRSQEATLLLVGRGHDAYNVAGGMQAWALLGGLVVTSGGAPGEVA